MAVASAMLAGLGLSSFYAAAICLLADNAPVAFGSIAIPAVTLAGVTVRSSALRGKLRRHVCVKESKKPHHHRQEHAVPKGKPKQSGFFLAFHARSG